MLLLHLVIYSANILSIFSHNMGGHTKVDYDNQRVTRAVFDIIPDRQQTQDVNNNPLGPASTMETVQPLKNFLSMNQKKRRCCTRLKKHFKLWKKEKHPATRDDMINSNIRSNSSTKTFIKWLYILYFVFLKIFL